MSIAVLIDFHDMIHRATEYVLQGQFTPQWKYILVDEFQDIAAPRAELIKALRDNFSLLDRTGMEQVVWLGN